MAAALHEWRQRHREFDTTEALSASNAGAADPTKYLIWLRERTAWIDIRGLQVGANKAYRFPIQDLYIPLTTADGSADRQQRRNVPLEEALARRRVVIVGDPGSGKTTFLRRLAFEACTATGSLAVPTVAFPILISIAELEEHISSCSGRKGEGIPTTAKSADWLCHFLESRKWDLVGSAGGPRQADTVRAAVRLRA